jgi:hypothetical protein
MRLCRSAPPEYEPWCHIGYAKNLVDVTADSRDGFAYCRLLGTEAAKQACNVAVGEEIWVLADDLERRESLCQVAEPAYVAACRFGAGLSETALQAVDEPTSPVSPRR